VSAALLLVMQKSLFNSKAGSKAREWRLTWLPFDCKNPTHDWEKWQPENKSTGAKAAEGKSKVSQNALKHGMRSSSARELQSALVAQNRQLKGLLKNIEF
jgi:hypothetical protein